MITTMTVKTEGLYSKIAKGCACHLLTNQVIAKNKILNFAKNNPQEFTTKLLNSCRNTTTLSIKRLPIPQNGHNTFEISCPPSLKKIQVIEKQFFRVSSQKKLGTVPGFTGLQPTHKSIPDSDKEDNPNPPPSNIFRKNLIKFIDTIPFIATALRKTHTVLFPEPPTDLSGIEGVTFYIETNNNQSVIITCYDTGGIYDKHLNAEGIHYPPQVAGNYYADAYSICVFGRLHKVTKEKKWQDARTLALNFLKRIYPQYKPAAIAWHHSDFKNAAILEELIENKADKFSFDWPEENYFEDRYEPTNVFALRYHWQSLHYLHYGSKIFFNQAKLSLQVVKKDQTQQGLIHDNIATYPDAHDLTYHQYSCACLGLAALHTNNEACWDVFEKATLFSLRLLGPEGEPAYTGRASNNIHQSASAILAFQIAALRHKDSNPLLSGQFIRGVNLIATRLSSFQLSSGMLATAMNNYTDKRVAWNHCETPYNALTAFFLLRAREVLNNSGIIEEKPVPLEQKNTVVANDSGYAVVSTGKSYLTVFGGCDKSYGWSEMRHITGCAGIALFGYLGKKNMHPSLDFKTPEEVFITDLPVINSLCAFGRSTLQSSSNQNSVLYRHRYAGAAVCRLYTLTENNLIITSSIQPVGNEISIEGFQAWPVLTSNSSTIKRIHKNQYLYRELYFTVEALEGKAIETITLSKKVTNAKGMAQRLNFGSGVISNQHRSIMIISRHKSKTTIDHKTHGQMLSLSIDNQPAIELDISEFDLNDNFDGQ